MTKEDILYNLARKISTAKSRELPELWRAFFGTALRRMGFNPDSRKALYKWGKDGYNWDDLHRENTVYAKYPNTKMIEAFKAEVYYISDRVSLDRLFRAHWIYNQIDKQQ